MAKGKPKITQAEREFILAVKSLPCIICGNPPINEFDHVTDCGRRLGHSWGISLCTNCHRGQNGYSSHKCGWDTTTGSQLRYCRQTYRKLGRVMPMPYSKIPNYYERMLEN